MKFIIQLLIAIPVSIYTLKGQVVGTNSANLNINNAKTYFLPSADMFLNHSGSVGSFFIPKNGNTSPAFVSSLWLGALDGSGLLKMAAQTYRQNGNDFFCGTLDTISSVTTSSASNFNKMWNLRKTMIDSFKLGLFTTTPADILSWPGNGNSSLNEAHKLSPFVDLNNNGMYEPANGDYPDIIGDQALFSIYNDRGGMHGETNGLPLACEVHAMPYAFSCTDSAFYNTVFVHYEIINGQYAYPTFHISMFNDYDLGNYNDDFIGCDTTTGLTYVYNGDSLDDLGPWGGYGDYPPAFGMMFLNKPLFEHMYWNNNIGTPPPATLNPSNAVQYYGYMVGLWRDGSHLMTNGNGYNTSGIGGVNTNFAFSGDPVSGTGWTEKNAGNVKGDRRSISTIGPYNMPAFGRISFDVAYIFARDYSAYRNQFAPITLLKQRAQTIKNSYLNNQTPCGIWSGIDQGKGVQSKNNIILYPNPSMGELNVTGVLSGSLLEIFSADGKILFRDNINENSKTILLNEIPDGFYFVRISGTDFCITKKISIQR